MTDVTTSGDLSPASYQDFIASKLSLHVPVGFAPSDLSRYGLFDFQSAIVDWAVKRGRAAIFADTGLGKTACQLAFADQVATFTGKPVLILAPLCVAQQTVREAQRIGIADCRYARTKALVIGSRIVVVNYEMLEHFAGVDWGGVVLDESSILKSFEGKIRNALISQFSGVDYRLSCTATPSPNDFMELGNQAEFLGVMSRTEMLAQFFIHDGGDTSQWRLKGHGKTVFWQWMSTWAVCIRSPADLGFDGSRYILPPLNTYQHTVDAPFVPSDQLFSTVALTLNDRRAAKRVSIEDRVKAVVLLIKSENDKIVFNLQNNRSKTDGLETRVSGESGSENCRRPRVSGEVSATDQERPGEAKSLSSGVLQGESREVQDNTRTASRAQCGTEDEVRGKCRIQGDGKTESEGMARCESSQKAVAANEKLRNPDNGLSGFACETEWRMRDLRIFGYEKPEDVSGNRSLPQDRECQGSALYELQSGVGEIQGQHRIPDVSGHVPALPKWVIWCHLNPEQDALEVALKENGIAFVSIRGATKIEEKIKLESDWRLGSVQVMLTKPSVFGFGMNWQCCSNVCFVGLDDSYEAYYQAVRRCYRFGQTRPVEVHIISSEGEGAILKNIERKAAQAQEMSAAMVGHMREFSQREIHGAHRETNDYERDIAGDEDWTLHLGDCVDVVSEMESNSIGYTVFSPPFASLYTYSNSHRDMGNCRGHTDFYQHFRFLVDELLRVTKDGRLLSFHCTNIPMMKGRDGQIGIHDFRGELIKLFVDAGWIFHSEVVIWKDPVTAMQRTKALGLLYKQLRKDSCMSRMGIPDYLVTMRKPGVNHDPVTKTHDGFPVSLWQQYASPVWMDVNPTRTLQYRAARDNDDERHICLSSGSLVLTREYGYIEIEDVEPSDHVLTHRGRWMPVLAKRCNGIAETIRICAHGVADLTVTPDHKLWAKKASGARAKEAAIKRDPEWMESQDTLGSYLNLKLPPEEPNELTADEWWIIGRWLGDGHRGSRRTSGARGAGFGEFIISCAHEEFAELSERLGKYAGHSALRTATQVTLKGLRSEVREALNSCGQGAGNKRLPGEAFTLSKEKSQSLLDGYLSADGHYVEKHDRHCASSISRALLLGMAMVAQRAYGVVASVYAGRPARQGEIEGRPVNMRQDWIFGFRMSEGYKKSGWIDDEGAWKKVRKIECADEREVWDLQVAEDASFTAEGCIVHNCPLQLDVIERAIELWSNPGDVVFSPFAGIGSEGYVALQMGRRFVGAELKRSYFDVACRNLASAKSMQGGLFAESEDTLHAAA